MDPIDPEPVSPATVGRPGHVLVTYEASADGRAALAHALGIARAADAPLTVIAVVPHERVDVGCARCRRSAVIWNHELGEIADEELMESARLVGPSSAVAYNVVRGPRTRAISDAAARSGADLIVLPWRRPSRVRALFSRDLTERLSREGRWRVVVAPRAAAGPPLQETPDLESSGSDPRSHRPDREDAAQRDRIAASSTKSRQIRSGGSSGCG